MSESSPHSSGPAPISLQIDNELDAAKAIVACLKGLDPQKQERALRYASETLNLSSPQLTSTLSPTPTPTATQNTPSTESPKRPVDIKTFTASKAPKSDIQFAVIVAYYYRFEAPPEQRRETINDALLREAVRMVVRNQPSRNILHNAKNGGYLDAVGGGEFRINTVGENLVAVTLPNNDNQTPRRRSAKKKAKSKSPGKAQKSKAK